MNKLLLLTILASFGTGAQATEIDLLDFEPCVNGGVSASGNYTSQEIEDQYGPYGLEASINGGVSASGLFPTQALEDQHSYDNEARPSDMYVTQ